MEGLTFIQQRRAEQKAIEESFAKKMMAIYEQSGAIPSGEEQHVEEPVKECALDSLDIFIPRQ